MSLEDILFVDDNLFIDGCEEDGNLYEGDLDLEEAIKNNIL